MQANKVADRIAVYILIKSINEDLPIEALIPFLIRGFVLTLIDEYMKRAKDITGAGVSIRNALSNLLRIYLCRK